MPNHVYCGITIADITKKQKSILQQWKSTLESEEPTGLCRHYLPMPESEKDNWYNWRLHNWNTKWGCYEMEIDVEEGTINFASAWSCIGLNIIELFSKDFPDFFYHWEEETGWGGEMEFENGECIEEANYDEPNWGDEIEYVYKKKTYYITELLDEHPNYDSGLGFYWDSIRFYRMM